MTCELRFAITTPGIDRSKLLIPEPIQQPAEPSGEAAHDPRWDRLAIAADQFVVAHRDGSMTILAGYPWFSDWGRDSMICLPGLLHARGRFDAAEQLLLNFAGQMRRGLIPNCFDDGSTAPQYNTADASLWFVHAVWLMRERLTHDARTQLVAACCEIIEAYTHGTDFGIACDHADGLIAIEDDGVHALTWMDAVRDGHRFTPRCGKPVEINALWHHALRCLTDLTDDAQQQTDLHARADRLRESFQQFWRGERSALHDTLQPGERPEIWRGDEAVRPNQLFAVSLGDDLLPADQQRAVLRVVRETLLTPVGVRTLAPSDAAYRPRYEGDMFDRDGAYHQGTVWPWLLGPYCEALLRAHDHSADALAEVRGIALRMLDELDIGCVGQLAEVYDGEEPRRPDGCPAQAWSVAELVRIGKMLHRMSDRRV